MPRQCHRVRLETGLSLRLPLLKRQGFIVPSARTMGHIRWASNGTNEGAVDAKLTADLTSFTYGQLTVERGDFYQLIDLRSQPRHFGGRQWYFECPVTRQLAAALWLPDGAKQFASRHAWAGQIAYSSQFETWQYRALRGAFRIRERLDPTGVFHSVGDIVPPKPKRMRWATYKRLLERLGKYERACDAYEQVLSERLGRLV